MKEYVKNFENYGIFNWIDFVNKNQDFKKNFENKEEILDYIKNKGLHDNLFITFLNNIKSYSDINVSFEHFDWITYLKINNDLFIKGITTKKDAWNHWIHHGKKEERSYSFINNTNIHKGRFGNLFFINMVLHFFACKYNLKCNYKYFNKFKILGIDFYVGKKIYDKNLLITEKNFLDIIKNHNESTNVIITNNVWFQDYDVCLYLKNFFNRSEIKKKIINNNLFKDRYNNNNDLFVHIRLGDIVDKLDDLSDY